MRGIAKARLAERTAEWRRGLPKLVEAAAARFGLTIEDTIGQGGTPAAVFAAKRADGAEVVLKLAPPGQALEAEATALGAFGGVGAARLLDADHRLGALLLERLRPGTSLSTVAAEDDEAATRVAAEVMNVLRQPPPAGAILADAAGWVRALDRAAKAPGPLPRAQLRRATALIRTLSAEAPAPVLLHGDLHNGNILRDGAKGWRAIDPKGLIGDPAFEAAAFLRNAPDGTRARQRIAALAAGTGLDEARIAAWGFVGAVLAAAWAIEDGVDPTRWLAAAVALEPSLG